VLGRSTSGESAAWALCSKQVSDLASSHASAADTSHLKQAAQRNASQAARIDGCSCCHVRLGVRREREPTPSCAPSSGVPVDSQAASDSRSRSAKRACCVQAGGTCVRGLASASETDAGTAQGHSRIIGHSCLASFFAEILLPGALLGHPSMGAAMSSCALSSGVPPPVGSEISPSKLLQAHRSRACGKCERRAPSVSCCYVPLHRIDDSSSRPRPQIARPHAFRAFRHHVNSSRDGGHRVLDVRSCGGSCSEDERSGEKLVAL
jgi:hypothetical protein